MSLIGIVIVNLVLFVVGELLKKPPDVEDAEAIPFEDANIPSVDPRRRIPVIWGRVRLKAPQVISVADYFTIPIKQKIKVSIFKSTKVIVAHRYVVGMALAMCNSGATLKKIYYNDELIWSGTAAPNDNGVEITVNLPEVLGGSEKGGGIIGTFRYYGGGSNQNTNAYLSGKQPDSPAYRHVSYIVLEGVEIGESPDLSGLSFECERYISNLGLGTNHKIGNDQNPVEIINELFLDDDFGYGLPDVQMDTAALKTAGDTLFAESNGASFKWVNPESISDIISTVVNQINGLVVYSPNVGKWQVVLARNDYVVGDLLVLDDSNCVVEEFSRAHWSETLNQVVVQFSDRDSTEPPTPIIVQDTANFSRQNGRHKIATLTFPGVYERDVADTIAARELKQRSFPLSSVNLMANRQSHNLLPGSVFVLSYSPIGITSLVMRVTEVGLGEPGEGKLRIKAVEDVFGISGALFASQDSLHVSVAGDPQVVATWRADDLPYFLSILQDDAFVATENRPLIMAKPPQGNATGIRMYVGGNEEQLGEFTPVGSLNADLDEDTADTVTSVVVTSTSLAQAISGTTWTDSEIQTLARGFVLIERASGDPEFAAYESATVVGAQVTMNNLHRGLVDTLPCDHVAGDLVWFIGESINTTISAYTAAQAISVQLSTQTNIGESGLNTAKALTFRNRQTVPYPPGAFKVGGSRYPATVASGDIAFTWAHRGRLSNEIRFQDDPGQTIESDTQYLLEIFRNSDSLKLRSVGSTASGGVTNDTTPLTGEAYTWTAAMQTTDGANTGFTVELSAIGVSSKAGLSSLQTVVRAVTIV